MARKMQHLDLIRLVGDLVGPSMHLPQVAGVSVGRAGLRLETAPTSVDSQSASLPAR